MLGAISPLAQIDLSNAFENIGGVRFVTGLAMLIHMFFAQLFVGFAIAAPVLQAWGARTGSPRMDRLAHSMARFNVLTFSTGATFAVLFLVLLVGLYPQVTTSLFTNFFYFIVIAMASMGMALGMMYTYYYKWDRYSVLYKGWHIMFGFGMGFFIWVWMVIMTGIDTYMLTGGGPNIIEVTQGNVASFSVVLREIFNPMFVEMVLHRTFANLSWPAFALAAWASFMYIRSKTQADRAFYDWSTSVGLTWGVGFLMLMPFVGFAIAYSMKVAQPVDPVSQQAAGGAFERLTSGATSNLLLINTILVVLMFVLSNVAMYTGAGRHPEGGGRVPIRFFALVATVAGIYAISPLANFPFFYMRYLMMTIMAVATLGAFLTYFRGRLKFKYGSPGTSYRVVLMGLGVLAAVVALNMGFMKSNSRVPFTVYNQPDYTVEPGPPPSGFGR
ncbi:MAG: cytochrome ubiquinol oxidase subunit I [Rubrobacteraceae bacterium]